GIIDPCLGPPVLFQSLHTRLGLAKKVFARAEAEAVRRASLDAGGLESHGDAVCTEGALVNLLCDWIQLGHVERTAGHAIAAADALVLIEIDDAVRVLDDGAGRGARAQATRIDAVHALILGHEPHRLPVLFGLVELDQVPEAVRQIGKGLVGPGKVTDGELLVVPFLAGHLARLAADTGRSVDQLGDRVAPRRRGRASGRRRNCLEIRAGCHIFCESVPKILSGATRSTWLDTKFTNRSSFAIMAGTALPRSHRGTGVSPVNDWAHSLPIASHVIPPSQATTSVVATAPRSGRNLARGERFLRTPGIRACLTTRPGRGGGTTKNSLANGVPHLALQPRRGGVIFLAGRITQGFAKSAHPWLISSHPSGVEEQLELRAGLRPKGAGAHV